MIGVRAGERVTPLEAAVEGAAPRTAFVTIDHEWRVADVSLDALDMFGWSSETHRGTALQSSVNAADSPQFLLALGRSAAERRVVTTRVRVRRSGGDWIVVDCSLSPLCAHNPARYALTLSNPGSGAQSDAADERASRLEKHLTRIAWEVHEATAAQLPALGASWLNHPSLRDLTERQAEILRHLITGERVDVIARTLYVSESTVRNHLSAIFRVFGVRSQSELLAALMGPPG